MDEREIQEIRAARRRKQLVDQATAPSYWSAFSGWQWLAAGVLLGAVIAVLVALS